MTLHRRRGRRRSLPRTRATTPPPGDEGSGGASAATRAPTAWIHRRTATTPGGWIHRRVTSGRPPPRRRLDPGPTASPAAPTPRADSRRLHAGCPRTSTRGWMHRRAGPPPHVLHAGPSARLYAKLGRVASTPGRHQVGLPLCPSSPGGPTRAPFADRAPQHHHINRRAAGSGGGRRGERCRGDAGGGLDPDGGGADQAGRVGEWRRGEQRRGQRQGRRPSWRAAVGQRAGGRRWRPACLTHQAAMPSSRTKRRAVLPGAVRTPPSAPKRAQPQEARSMGAVAALPTSYDQPPPAAGSPWLQICRDQQQLSWSSLRGSIHAHWSSFFIPCRSISPSP